MSRFGLDRRTEALIGTVFLIGMVVTLILAIATFEGTPTVLLILTSFIFLAVALFFFSGTGSGRGAGAGDEGQSQQQSVVLGGGATPLVQKQGGGVYVVCRHCGNRSPESAEFCPSCGKSLEA